MRDACKDRGPRVGVAVIVRSTSGRVLLQQRRGSHGAGTWALPGGRMEGNETVLECAARELGEEVGIHVAPAFFVALPIWTHTDMGEGNVWVTLYTVVNAGSQWPYIREPGKCSALKWISPTDEPPGPLFQPLQTLLDNGFDLFSQESRP